MMTQRLVQNFSGVCAVVLQAPDRNRAVLIVTLTKLGLRPSPLDPGVSDSVARDALEQAELVFFDADVAESPRLPWGGELPPVPLVVLIGLETPSRLQRAFELRPSAVLHKPVRPSGIYSTLFFAANEHNRRLETAERLKVLEARRGSRRVVHKAVLRLMEQHGVDDEQAYRLLRKESMRQRVTVEELAGRIVAVCDDPIWVARKV
jgi:AmiR/NasT family two-component response regulator